MVIILTSEKDELDSFDFFKKKVEEKPKVKCAWCDKEIVNLNRHLKKCKKYLETLPKEIEKKEAKPSISEDFQAKIEKQISTLEKENIDLRKMIIDAQSLLKVGENPVITAILSEFATFDFDTLVGFIMAQYDLKKFDIVSEDGRSFFYTMSNIKSVEEITNSKEKFDVARFLNRINRGDSKMYKVLFKWIKDRVLSIIKEYS